MENNDWTDILYILVALAFGIIGKLAKKKPKPAPKKTEQAQPEEFVVEESTSQSEEIVGEGSTPMPKKSRAESIFDTIYKAVLDEDISGPVIEKEDEVYTEEVVQEEMKKEVTAKKSGLEELLDKRHEEELREEKEREEADFDLREAVVYSEILNKKYSY